VRVTYSPTTGEGVGISMVTGMAVVVGMVVGMVVFRILYILKIIRLCAVSRVAWHYARRKTWPGRRVA